MNGLNKAYLIGNIGADPETRTTQTGLSVLKLSVATPNNRKVEDRWVDVPDWHRLTLFGRAADFVQKYARKGSGIAVECVLRPNKWTGKDGATHHSVDLIVERVLWLQSDKKTVTPDADLAMSPVEAQTAGAEEEAGETIPF